MNYIIDGDTIVFIDNFNDNIKFTDFMLKYKKIKFGGQFNQQITNIPPTFTHITFGFNFNQPIDSLHEGLQYLKLGYEFNYPIDSLPSTLIHLNMESCAKFNYPIDMLPSSLQYLSLGNAFKQPMDMLPSNLLDLKLCSCYYLPLLNLPESLKYLRLGYYYDAPNNINKLPNIEFIEVYNDDYYNPDKKGFVSNLVSPCISPSIKYFSVPNYNKQLELPKNMHYLYLKETTISYVNTFKSINYLKIISTKSPINIKTKVKGLVLLLNSELVSLPDSIDFLILIFNGDSVKINKSFKLPPNLKTLGLYVFPHKDHIKYQHIFEKLLTELPNSIETLGFDYDIFDLALNYNDYDNDNNNTLSLPSNLKTIYCFDNCYINSRINTENINIYKHVNTNPLNINTNNWSAEDEIRSCIMGLIKIFDEYAKKI